MSIFQLALIGGFISFLSTSLGVVISFLTQRVASSSRWSLSVDFALGLMVSASAFSLIGPVALEANLLGNSMMPILFAAILGAAFVALVKWQIDSLQSVKKMNSSHLILASVLMLHNFPEGLASGSALAGLSFQAALPILSGISIQNVPEGALMVMCLISMGWSKRWSLVGGFASGLVELFGGIFAGLLLQSVQGVLPALLSFAGGSMMASVIIELSENSNVLGKRIGSKEFIFGLVSLPLLQVLIS